MPGTSSQHSSKSQALDSGIPMRQGEPHAQLVNGSIRVAHRQGFRVHDDNGTDPADFDVSSEEDSDELSAPVPPAQPASTNSRLMLAVPELTQPGESQPNELAERTVPTIECVTPTTLASTQAKVKTPNPGKHTVLDWAVRHAIDLLCKYQLGTNGLTAWCRLPWTEAHEHICEVGEHPLRFVPPPHHSIKSKLGQA